MKKIIFIICIIVVITLGYFLWSRKNDKQESYTEYKIQRENIIISILATGTVQPKNRLEIKAPVAGRIDSILINEGSRVKKGQILSWMSSTERAAMLDAARAKGEEEYKKWSELYLPTPVLAPISGTIILKNVEPGQTFTNADAIFTMSDHLTVKAQVDETDIAQIKLKSKAKIILDAYPTAPIEATVDQLAFDATTTNNVTTYAIDVRPETTPEFMRSGMTANVTFIVESKENVLTIPAEALKIKNEQNTVLTNSAQGPINTNVEIGISDGRKIEIIKGLNEGDTILLQNYNLGDEKSNSSNPFGPKMPNQRKR